MILYIHGFASSGMGSKAQVFRSYFKAQSIPFFAPSLSTIPDLAIQTLEEFIESYSSKQIGLIGSSLGGFFAMYLAAKYNLKAVLINPAIKPYELLQTFGQTTHFFDGSAFEFCAEHAQMLKRFEVFEPDQSRLLLMLQTGDDVLDYRMALNKLEHTNVLLEEGGSHSFDGIDRHLEFIKQFLT